MAPLTLQLAKPKKRRPGQIFFNVARPIHCAAPCRAGARTRARRRHRHSRKRRRRFARRRKFPSCPASRCTQHQHALQKLHQHSTMQLHTARRARFDVRFLSALRRGARARVHDTKAKRKATECDRTRVNATGMRVNATECEHERVTYTV